MLVVYIHLNISILNETKTLISGHKGELTNGTPYALNWWNLQSSVSAILFFLLKRCAVKKKKPRVKNLRQIHSTQNKLHEESRQWKGSGNPMRCSSQVAVCFTTQFFYSYLLFWSVKFGRLRRYNFYHYYFCLCIAIKTHFRDCREHKR